MNNMNKKKKKSLMQLSVVREKQIIWLSKDIS